MRVPAAVAVPLVLSGCISMTAGETGRALGSEGLSLTGAITSGAFSEVSINGDRDSFSDDPLPVEFVPVLEAGAAYGVGPRTDLGVRANTAAFVAARAKHQLAGTATSPFALALGAEGGGNVGSFFIGYAYVYGSASATASYHPSPKVALLASARYLAVAVEPFAPPPDAGRTEGSGWAFPSLSYGVAVGERDQLAVEVAHTRPGSPSQAAIAYRHRLR